MIVSGASDVLLSPTLTRRRATGSHLQRAGGSDPLAVLLISARSECRHEARSA